MISKQISSTKNHDTLPSADKLNQTSVQSSTKCRKMPTPQTHLLSIEKSSKIINTSTGNTNVTSCEQRMLTASITSNQKSNCKMVNGTKSISQGYSKQNPLNKSAPYKLIPVKNPYTNTFFL